MFVSIRLINFARVKRKASTYALPLLALLWLAAGCGPRVIPDRKMEGIIHDIFLSNAYYTQFGQQKIRIDSVDFYTPILENYGYDIADFRHTLDRWALQKSSRLTDLIGDATADIQRENQRYEYRGRLQRRIDTLIRARYLDTLLFRPDSIDARGSRDADRLTFRLASPAGSYRIRYGYRLPPNEDNERAVMRYRVYDSGKAVVETSSRSLVRDAGGRIVELSFEAPVGADSLELILAEYPSGGGETVFHADSVLVTRNAPIEELRERLPRDMIRLRTGLEILSPYELDFPPRDSGALRVVPPLRVDTAASADL